MVDMLYNTALEKLIPVYFIISGRVHFTNPACELSSVCNGMREILLRTAK